MDEDTTHPHRPSVAYFWLKIRDQQKNHDLEMGALLSGGGVKPRVFQVAPGEVNIIRKTSPHHSYLSLPSSTHQDCSEPFFGTLIT